MKSDKADPVTKLLKILNSFPEIGKAYKTLYGASQRLLNMHPNSTVFEYISILSYNKEKELLEQLNEIYLGNFYQDITNFKFKAFQCFIDCIDKKRHLENEYVNQKILDLIGEISSSSFVLKYIKMIEPLIKEKDNIYQTKIKLLVMIPNNFHKLYSEMSKEFHSFPDSVIDFYSFNKINDNYDSFQKLSKEKKNAINGDDNTKNLKEEFLSFKNIVNNRFDSLQKENSEIKIELKTVKEKYENLKEKCEKLKEKCEKLKENIYQINFRDTIKSFLDKLMETLNIFNYNLTLSMKITSIKEKLNNLSCGLKNNEKKCVNILIDILDHLYTANQTGDNFSHFFNNLGFDIENLPQKVKEKYLLYTNINTGYDDVSLIISSLNGLITEKQEKIMNLFLKKIISQPLRGNPQERKNEIIECIKSHSNLLVA